MRNIDAFLHDNDIQVVALVSFKTAVEFNVHNFPHSTFNAQTYKQHTNKHKQLWHIHRPTTVSI